MDERKKENNRRKKDRRKNDRKTKDQGEDDQTTDAQMIDSTVWLNIANALSQYYKLKSRPKLNEIAAKPQQTHPYTLRSECPCMYSKLQSDLVRQQAMTLASRNNIYEEYFTRHSERQNEFESSGT